MSDQTQATTVTLDKSGSNPPSAALPAQAVSQGTDLVAPAQALLQGVYLLGSSAEMESTDGAGAVFKGAPQSVAVIEAGATALSKWWAAGLGAFVVATWGSVKLWWGSIDAANQHVVLWAAAIVAAAAILGISYIVGSDVRGRSAASVATIQARATIVSGLAKVSKDLYAPSPASPTAQLLALPTPLHARNRAASSELEEPNWKAIALKTNGDDTNEYLLVKGSQHAWVTADKVDLG